MRAIKTTNNNNGERILGGEIENRKHDTNTFWRRNVEEEVGDQWKFKLTVCNDIVFVTKIYSSQLIYLI